MHVCELCFGPLEVQSTTYEAIGPQHYAASSIQSWAALTMWRYADLLPLERSDPWVGKQVGFTPLVRAENLG